MGEYDVGIDVVIQDQDLRKRLSKIELYLPKKTLTSSVEAHVDRTINYIAMEKMPQIMRDKVMDNVSMEATGKLATTIYGEKIDRTHYYVGTHGIDYAKALEYGRGPVKSKFPKGPLLYDSNSFFKRVGPQLKVGPAKGIHFAQKTINECRKGALI